MRKTTFILFATLSLVSNAQFSSFNWHIADGGIGADRSAALATDAHGNVYSANSFVTAAGFNSLTLTGAAKGSGANADNNLLVTKTTANKSTLWHVQSNDGAVTPTAIAVNNNNVYVTGSMRAIVNTANQTNSARIIDANNNNHSFSGLGSTSATTQAFLWKLNENGHTVWVKEFNSNNKTTAVTINNVAADLDGNIVLTGSFVNSLIVPGNSTAYTSTSIAKAAFVSKIDSNTGNEIWTVTSTGGMSSEDITALAIDNEGSIYCAGIFRNVSTPVNTNFGTITFTPSKDFSLVVMKIKSNGIVSYIQSFDNDKDTRVSCLVVDNQNIYISGAFRGDGSGIAFTPALTSSAAFLNGYIASFNKMNGSAIWQKTVSSTGITDAAVIALASDGKLYAFGAYANKTGSSIAGEVGFGNNFSIADTNPSNTSADLYLATYDPANGTTLHVQRVASSSSWETANAIASTASKLYLLGTSNSTSLNYGGTSNYVTKGGYDILMLAYNILNPSTGNVQNAAGNINLQYYAQSNALCIKNAKGHILQLFDIGGKVLLRTKIYEENQMVNLNIIPNGIIIGHIMNDKENVFNFKIIR